MHVLTKLAGVCSYHWLQVTACLIHLHDIIMRVCKRTRQFLFFRQHRNTAAEQLPATIKHTFRCQLPIEGVGHLGAHQARQLRPQLRDARQEVVTVVRMRPLPLVGPGGVVRAGGLEQLRDLALLRRKRVIPRRQLAPRQVPLSAGRPERAPRVRQLSAARIERAPRIRQPRCAAAVCLALASQRELAVQVFFARARQRSLEVQARLALARQCELAGAAGALLRLGPEKPMLGTEKKPMLGTEKISCRSPCWAPKQHMLGNKIKPMLGTKRRPCKSPCSPAAAWRPRCRHCPDGCAWRPPRASPRPGAPRRLQVRQMRSSSRRSRGQTHAHPPAAVLRTSSMGLGMSSVTNRHGIFSGRTAVDCCECKGDLLWKLMVLR